MPTFIAPNLDGVLVFALTVVDALDRFEVDTVTVTVVRVAPVLFIANSVGNAILSFTDPGMLDGNVEPTTALAGAATLLDGPGDLIITPARSMIVTNANQDSLQLFRKAKEKTGNVEPFFIVQGDSTQLDRPTSIAHDAARDLVFVSNSGTNNDILEPIPKPV